MDCLPVEWISLHADALASVLRYLHRQKDILAATGVCSHWRAVGTALFFSGSTWQGEAAILHPAQLLTLCALDKAPGGLIRGQVRRVKGSWGLGGRRQRLLFEQVLPSRTGQALLPAKFLLAAEQRGSGGWAVFMDRGCNGQPVAHLSTNTLRTVYHLTAAASSSTLCRGDSMGRRRSSSSSSSGGTLWHRDSSGSTTPAGTPTTTPTTSPLSRASTGSSLLCLGDSVADASCSRELGPAGLTGPGTATPATSTEVLMALQYKLHVRAMVLPRRMSVTLQVPSQHTQRSLCSNSRTGQPTAAWVSGSSAACDSLKPGTQQQPLPCHGQQQGGSTEPPVADLGPAAGVAGVEGDGQKCLENVLPQWNNSLRMWCLNFNGRVKLSSAKNFQLVAAAAKDRAQPQQGAAAGGDMNSSVSGLSTPPPLLGSPGTNGVVVQFGKTEPHAFILDYDPCVTTALQAFAVALTTFGTKIFA